MNLIIFGAQAIALGTYRAIKDLFPNYVVTCFLVTEIGNNATILNGIPVRELGEFSEEIYAEEKENTKVLIATPENVMGSIEESLKAAGFKYVIRMDSLKWAKLQQQAFAKSGNFMPLSIYPVGIHKPWIQVYKVKFFKDKKISTNVVYPDYMIDLQVGAALTEIRVAEFLDNIGDNISERNPNYSELTGLYWVWKNQILTDDKRSEHYYGLAHYRRLLELSDEDLLRLQDNEIDVVLPYPMPYEPNIEEHHKRYLSENEWNAVMQVLEELQPDYAKAFEKILKQEYFYNYNIVIAKGDVLEAYCAWLFPLLFRIEKINNQDGLKIPNRYIGYVGETLETLYFMYHKETLRIAHAGCHFFV